MNPNATDEHPQFTVAELTADEYWLYRTFLPIFVPITTLIVVFLVGWYFMGFGLGLLYALGFPLVCAIAYAILQAKRNRAEARPIPVAHVVNQPPGYLAPIAQPVHPGQPPMAIPVADQQPPMAIPVSPQQPPMAIPVSPYHPPLVPQAMPQPQPASHMPAHLPGRMRPVSERGDGLGLWILLGIVLLILLAVAAYFEFR